MLIPWWMIIAVLLLVLIVIVANSANNKRCKHNAPESEPEYTPVDSRKIAILVVVLVIAFFLFSQPIDRDCYVIQCAFEWVQGGTVGTPTSRPPASYLFDEQIF